MHEDVSFTARSGEGTRSPVNIRHELDNETGDSVAGTTRLKFDLSEMEVLWDAHLQTLWSYMTPTEQPKYTEALLRDMRRWQIETQKVHGAATFDMRYLVLGCRHPGGFNLGGDLAYVAGAIEARDQAALEDYGNRCVDILYQNLTSLGLPVITIALIQGDAIGGGLESALSFNVLIAERHVQFSLPENAFGMFPGVGAHSLLSRRLGTAQAEQMMLSGRTYSADEMHALGLVHVVADTGKGEEAARRYIQQNSRRFNGQLGVYRAMREVTPVPLEELRRIVRIWAETGMQLTAQQGRMLKRLAEKQLGRDVRLVPSVAD